MVAGSLTALALLPACASTHPSATPQATVPVTSATADPYAVPAKITRAYVQRVLDALDRVEGDAARLIVARKSLVPEAAWRLRSIDSDSWFQESTATWADDLANHLANYKVNPGDRVDHVTELLSASSSCVFVKAESDFSAVAANAAPPQTNYIQLVPLSSGRDPKHFNPTPWIVGIEGYNSKGLSPTNPCGGPAS